MAALKVLIRFILVFVALLGGLNFWYKYSWEKVDGAYDVMEPKLMRDSRVPINITKKDVASIQSYEDVVQYKSKLALRMIWKIKPPDHEPYTLYGRVVAKPGDALALQGQKIKVNGQDVNEHLTTVESQIKPEEEYSFETIIIPRGYAYVMLDKRDLLFKREQVGNRVDSRILGPIPISSIQGIVDGPSNSQLIMLGASALILLLVYVFLDTIIKG